jgi:ribosomal protein S18 acetylase RimI-like enzyme
MTVTQAPLGFRLATLADLDRVITLVGEYHALDHLPFDPEQVRPVLSKLIETPTLGQLWVIEEGKAGYVLLTYGYSIEYLGRDAFIDELYLRPEFRGQGWGRAALDFVSAQAKREGLRAIHLECERDNSNALRLYRSYGFKDPDRVLMTSWL